MVEHCSNDSERSLLLFCQNGRQLLINYSGAGFSKRREGAGCTRGTRTRYPGFSKYFCAGYGFPGWAREGRALPLLGAVVASAGK